MIRKNTVKFKRFSGKSFLEKPKWTWWDQFKLELQITVINFWQKKFGPHPRTCVYGCLASCPYLWMYPDCPYMVSRWLWREIIYGI